MAEIGPSLLSEEAEVSQKPVGVALIIGGGIAGIQAALDIADAGYKVYLVEREPSVGGRMAQLDKTFPTLDCSSCILTPKMVDVGQHPNIELMTYSEVVSVTPPSPTEADGSVHPQGGGHSHPLRWGWGECSACGCARSRATWMWTSAPVVARARRRAG